MLEIRSNGSKWAGQQPDSIETLLEVLESHPLDPTFENYGNFVSTFRPLYDRWTESNEKYRGCTSFFGNFAYYSHVFHIATDEPEVIEVLTTAIRKNQQREDYAIAKREREEMERTRQEELQKRLEVVQ